MRDTHTRLIRTKPSWATRRHGRCPGEPLGVSQVIRRYPPIWLPDQALLLGGTGLGEGCMCVCVAFFFPVNNCKFDVWLRFQFPDPANYQVSRHPLSKPRLNLMVPDGGWVTES